MKTALFRKLFFQHAIVILYLPLFYLFSESLYFPVRILLGGVTALVIALVFSEITARSLSGRLNRINGCLRQIKDGSQSQPYIGGPESELSGLENTVAELSLFFKKQSDVREQEEGQLAAVLSSMDEGVLVIDSAGDIILANKKAREFFGDQLEGDPVTDKIRDPVLLKYLDQSRKERKAVDFELDSGLGTCSSIAVSLSPFLTKERVSGSVIVLYDISWLKKLENMRKDFVANVSHELKTPLTAIQGFSETLLSGGLEDRENSLRFLKNIEGNASRMSRLVTDLLTLSDIELGKTAFNIERLDLKEVIDSVIADFSPAQKKSGVQIKPMLEEVSPVMADRDMLKQILINLLDNSMKYTDSGEISITASQGTTRGKGVGCDTGVG
ncbi:MAG: sensor histidine kinase, partial [Nitrospinota bacterium]